MMVPMKWLLANWRVLAAVGIVVGVLLAAYGKGYYDADTKWELKVAKESAAREKRGKVATRDVLEGFREDLEKINARPDAPVIRLRCPTVPLPSGGVADSTGPEPAGEMGRAVEAGRVVGRISADVLDEADRQAAQCNRLIEWWRKQSE